MIKYLSVILFFSSAVYAASVEQKKVTVVPGGPIVDHSDLLNKLCFKIRDQEDSREKRDAKEQAERPNWMLPREVGDEKDVQLLFALNHAQKGSTEKWPSDKQIWITQCLETVILNKRNKIEDVLCVSTAEENAGQVVGRHIRMSKPFDHRGIYTVSAKPNSKTVHWDYTRGIGV